MANQPDRVDIILKLVDYATAEAKKTNVAPADFLLEQYLATKDLSVRADLRDAMHLIRLDNSLGSRGTGPGMSMGL